jgi:hypothetical protein
MTAKRRLILAMVTIAAGAYMAVQLVAQAPWHEPFDYSNAAGAEVRDAQGQVVLRGQFSTTDADPNDTERKAMLSPTGIDADALGEAEIEVSGSATRRRQEIEFEVRNLQPGSVFTLAIDGRDFATVTTNSRGRAEHERDVPLP